MAIGKMVRVIFYEHNGDIILLYVFYKRMHKDTKDALAASLKILDKISDGEGAVLEKHREELILNCLLYTSKLHRNGVQHKYR